MRYVVNICSRCKVKSARDYWTMTNLLSVPLGWKRFDFNVKPNPGDIFELCDKCTKEWYALEEQRLREFVGPS